jgi:hypothetical protein
MISVATEVREKIVGKLVDELYPLFKDSVMVDLGLKASFEKTVETVKNNLHEETLISDVVSKRQAERQRGPQGFDVVDAASGGPRNADTLKAIEDEIKGTLEERLRVAEQKAAEEKHPAEENVVVPENFKKPRKPRTTKPKVTETTEDLVAVVHEIAETARAIAETPIATVLSEQEFIKATATEPVKATATEVTQTKDVFSELGEIKDVPTKNETPTKPATPVETETDEDFSFFADLKKAYEDPQNKVKALAKLSGTDTSDDIPF